jgi:hypothetical protein
MNDERINPFGGLDDFGTTDPTEKKAKPAQKAAVEQVAAANGFPSRQPAKPEAKPAPRQQRRYTTGRNQQINIKATAETIERFYRIADEHRAPLGEVLERALDALEKATK